MNKEQKEALDFYDENGYLQPFQCEIVVDALRTLKEAADALVATWKYERNPKIHKDQEFRRVQWLRIRDLGKALASDNPPLGGSPGFAQEPEDEHPMNEGVRINREMEKDEHGFPKKKCCDGDEHQGGGRHHQTFDANKESDDG